MKINSLHEYKDFVQRHNIPLDKIRFALGEDKGHEPRWFYIYQDRFTGEWVVAKSATEGMTRRRHVRYSLIRWRRNLTIESMRPAVSKKIEEKRICLYCCFNRLCIILLALG